MRRISLLCGQLVSLVQEIAGCVKNTAESAVNEAWNLFSEGPIKHQAGGSAGHIETHASHICT